MKNFLYFLPQNKRDIIRVNLDTLTKVDTKPLNSLLPISDFEVDENQTITYLTSQGELRQENPDNSSIPKRMGRPDGISGYDQSPLVACAHGFVTTSHEDSDGVDENTYYFMVPSGQNAFVIDKKISIVHPECSESEGGANSVRKLLVFGKETRHGEAKFIVSVLCYGFVDLLGFRVEGWQMYKCGYFNLQKPILSAAAIGPDAYLSTEDNVFRLHLNTNWF